MFAFDGARWRALPRMPEPRAAGGAAVVGGRLYVVGGVGAGGLARRAFALDLRTGRWSVVPAPTPREHLAVTAAGGRIYALGGRRAGYDTNVATFESWTPGEKRWRRLPDVPSAARRHRRRGRRRPPRLGRRRGARRDDRLGVRVEPRSRAAGAGCPTCVRRGTVSASSRSERASTRSAADRCPA